MLSNGPILPCVRPLLNPQIGVFRYNFRPEVDNDVMSGGSVDNVGVDVRVKFGDSRSNGFRDTNEQDEASPNNVKLRLKS